MAGALRSTLSMLGRPDSFLEGAKSLRAQVRFPFISQYLNYIMFAAQLESFRVGETSHWSHTDGR